MTTQSDEKVVNYYAVLGISFNATLPEIQQAMKKFTQTAPHTDENLAILMACKRHLLSVTERQQYNRQLLLDYPELLDAVMQQVQPVPPTQPVQAAQATHAVHKPVKHPPKTHNQHHPSQQQGSSTFFKVCMSIFGLIFFIGYLMSALSSDSDSDKKHITLSNTKVQVECEQLIKEYLKSPTSAKFSDWQFTEHSIWHFSAHGTVDSANAFGVMLRSRFTCDVEYNSETQKIKTTADFVK